jgi:hypothetical protein
MKRMAVFWALAAVAAVAVGCTELEQSAAYKDGKYRGKTDTRPWDNAPLAYGSSTWTKSDHASWENQMKARHEGQNEHRRIGH